MRLSYSDPPLLEAAMVVGFPSPEKCETSSADEQMSETIPVFETVLLVRVPCRVLSWQLTDVEVSSRR